MGIACCAFTRYGFPPGFRRWVGALPCASTVSNLTVSPTRGILPPCHIEGDTGNICHIPCCI